MISRLGFATFSTPDLDRMVDYYTGYLGLSLLARDTKSARLACRDGDCAVVLRQHAGSPSCNHLALELAADVDIEAFVQHANAMGVAVESRSDPEPDIAWALCLADPEGLQLSLFRKHDAKPRAETSGVVPNKLGHAAFYTRDVQRRMEFFRDLLHFRVSDWIGDFFVFMRCNADHHAVNFITGEAQGMHHIAFELRDWNHVKDACDLMHIHKLDLVWGPGRHGPGHNIFTYHLNPDGFTVEMFTELDTMSSETSGVFDSRPWHMDEPQRPKVWKPSLLARNIWGITKPDSAIAPRTGFELVSGQ